MSTPPFFLAHGATRELVPAVVHRDLPESTLDEIEAAWGPARRAGVERLRCEGREHLAGHAHWDWRNKSGRVRSGFLNIVGVECGGGWQGLIALQHRPRAARLAAGQLVYVDYLETAPWNYRPFCGVPRFNLVGSVLLFEATRISREQGFEGRIGLHSLEEAERFYENTGGMIRVGPDPDYYELSYFEMTAEQADRFRPDRR